VTSKLHVQVASLIKRIVCTVTHLTKFSHFNIVRVIRNVVKTLKPFHAPPVMVSHKNEPKYVYRRPYSFSRLIERYNFRPPIRAVRQNRYLYVPKTAFYKGKFDCDCDYSENLSRIWRSDPVWLWSRIRIRMTRKTDPDPNIDVTDPQHYSQRPMLLKGTV